MACKTLPVIAKCHTPPPWSYDCDIDTWQPIHTYDSLPNSLQSCDGHLQCSWPASPKSQYFPCGFQQGGFSIPEWRGTHSCSALCQACPGPPYLPWGSLHFLLYCTASPFRSWKNLSKSTRIFSPWLDRHLYMVPSNSWDTPHFLPYHFVSLFRSWKSSLRKLGRIFSPWVERHLCTTCVGLLQSLDASCTSYLGLHLLNDPWVNECTWEWSSHVISSS